MKVQDYFLFENPRAGQIEVIEKIQEAIEEGYNDIILDAGTGFGKSAVARAIIEYNVKENDFDSYLVTATKVLQRQYENDCKNNPFSIDYQVGLGRANFTCRHSINNGTFDTDKCDNGYCKNRRVYDPKCDYDIQNTDPHSHGGCSYWINKCKSIDSEVSLANYNVLISDNQYVHHYNHRDLMVLDEAHDIEQKIMDSISIILNGRRLLLDIDIDIREDFNNTNMSYWINQLKDIITGYENRLEIVETEIKKGNASIKVEEVKSIKKKITQYQKKLGMIEENPDNWAVCIDKFNDKVSFKPIFVSDYAYDLLFKSTDIRLYMSGSIIDGNQFANDLGLEDSIYIKANSSFDVKHRNPIYYRFGGNLGFKTKKSDLPKCIPKLTGIFNKHRNEKGLIHCNSKEFQQYILDAYANSKYAERLVTYNNDIVEGRGSKTYELNNFKKSDEPLIMVSYSMQEGVDLPYNECRFQVFFKAPYLPLNDNQIKERMNRDPNWYNVKSMQRFVQMHGRGMRAEDDYCRNYIIDKGFYRLIKDKKLPKEVKEAIL